MKSLYIDLRYAVGVHIGKKLVKHTDASGVDVTPILYF